MQSQHKAWALLRPVLLAAAAATSWLALTAGAASADQGPSRDPLLGSVSSSLNSVTGHVTAEAKNVLEPVKAGLGGGLAKAPGSTVASLVPTPSLAPVVQDVTTLTDKAVQSLPVVNKVVPAGTVPAVLDPVASTVDHVVDSTVGGTVVPVTEAVLTPLDPVLAPVTGVIPVPPTEAVEPPAIPVTPDLADPAGAVPVPALLPAPEVPAAEGSAPVSDSAPAPAQPASTAVNAPAASPAHDFSLTAAGQPHSLAPAAATVAAASGELPVPAPGHIPGEPLVGTPASTTGGAGTSGGNGPAGPAWLSTYNFHVPADGTAAVEGLILAAPAPVSFDPGSSPD
ncbi:hypothetical protein [Pseudarthrobacter chlorophenolicus]|uniref:hypothetical protein n=1 Tax=Pseudarthrobacter chlorophenolicus TaxID=85085 RepID=UPI0005F2EE31|nr:hypothetical protein [Pseudarthrobacter chlorophenolicus]